MRSRLMRLRCGKRVLVDQGKILGVVLSGFLILGCSGDAETSGISGTPDPALNSQSGSSPRASSSTISSTIVSSTGKSDVMAPLFDFTASDSGTDANGPGSSIAGWSVVNDTVMGGVSSGQLLVEDGALIFSGELSLDNNGGFASVRSPLIESRSITVWANNLGPRIVVIGDGRTWTVEVRTDDESGGWVATLPTSPDTITDVTIPWTSFEPVTRFLDPRETDGPLDPSRILSIAFYLVDGIEGPFRLGIRTIS